MIIYLKNIILTKFKFEKKIIKIIIKLDTFLSFD